MRATCSKVYDEENGVGVHGWYEIIVFCIWDIDAQSLEALLPLRHLLRLNGDAEH